MIPLASRQVVEKQVWYVEYGGRYNRGSVMTECGGEVVYLLSQVVVV